jgi:hypothetical protein
MSVNIAAQYDAALQAYLDNADYEETSSVTKARAFITACTKLIAVTPQATGSRDSHLQIKVDEYRQAKQAAQAWVGGNDTDPTTGTPPVTRASFEDYRR